VEGGGEGEGGSDVLVGDEHPLLRVWNEVWWSMKERERERRCGLSRMRFRPRDRKLMCVICGVVSKDLLLVVLERRKQRLLKWRNVRGRCKLTTLCASRLDDNQRGWASRVIFPRLRLRAGRARGGMARRLGIG